jgi:hypothetical protein
MAPDRSRRRTTTPDSAAAAAASPPPPPALSQRRSTRSTSAAALSPARAPPPPARSRGTTPVQATGGGGAGPVKELRRGRSRGPSVPPVEEHVSNEVRRPPLRSRKSGSKGAAAAAAAKASKAVRNDDDDDDDTPEPHPLSRHVSPDNTPAQEEQDGGPGPEPLSVVDDVDESASTLTRVETPTDEPAIPAVSVSTTSDHVQDPAHVESTEEQASTEASTAAAPAAAVDPMSDLFVSNVPPSPSIQAAVDTDADATPAIPRKMSASPLPIAPDTLSESLSDEQNRAAEDEPKPQPDPAAASASEADSRSQSNELAIPQSAVNLDGPSEGAEAPPPEMKVDSAAGAAQPASPVTESASLSVYDAAKAPMSPPRDGLVDQILEKAKEEEEVEKVEPEPATHADVDMRDGTRTGDSEKEEEVERDPAVPDEKVAGDDGPVVSDLSGTARDGAASTTISSGAEVLPPVSVSQAVTTVGPVPAIAAETDVGHKEEEEAAAAATSIDAKPGDEEGMDVETGGDSHAVSNGVDSSAVVVDASAPPPPPAATASVEGTSAPKPEVVAPVAESGIDKLATPVDNEPAIAEPNAATSKAVENEAPDSLPVDGEAKVDGEGVSPAEAPSAPLVAAAATTAQEPTLDSSVTKSSAESESESAGAPPAQVETSTLPPPMMTSDEAVAQATMNEAAPPPSRQADAEPAIATNEQLSAAPPLAKAAAAESIESVKHAQSASSENPVVVEQTTGPVSATSGPISPAIEAPTPVSTAVAAAAAEAAPNKPATSESPLSTPTTRANGSAATAAAPPLKRTPPLPAGGITMPPALQTMTPKDVRKRFNTHKIACVQTLNVQLIT